MWMSLISACFEWLLWKSCCSRCEDLGFYMWSLKILS